MIKFKNSILSILPYLCLIVALIVACFSVTVWGQSNNNATPETAGVTQSWQAYISWAVAIITAIGVLVQRLESAVTKVVSELSKLQSSVVTVDPDQNRPLLDAIARERRADCIGICGRNNGCKVEK